MQKQRLMLGVIIVLLLAAITVLTQVPLKLGLDLQGGSQLTIQVKTTKESPKIGELELAAVQKVVENRINGLGVAEALVQTVGSDQVLVQLPGVNDPKEAEKVLGGTAQLDFREQKPDGKGILDKAQQELAQATLKQQVVQQGGKPDPKASEEVKLAIEKYNQSVPEAFKEPAIVGKSLTDASVEPTQVNDKYDVGLVFDDAGAKAFADLTKNLAGTGRSIGIFLDNKLISSATVDAKFAVTGITGGRAVIQGNFNAKSARELAIQLKGGSLPNPVEIVENRTVGATLGKDSIQSSIYAGIGGLLLVLIFMGVYYRVPGIVANASLIIYSIFNLAIFASLGVTLTLPGIAGFVLSIGMAVDANVLIFERTREELRAGKTLYRSVESGFYRAFSSILDGNLTTLIACAALFYLGSGLVKGFALTLAVGVVVSMFTALTCTRTFLLLLVLNVPALRQRPQLFCPNLADFSTSNTELKID